MGKDRDSSGEYSTSRRNALKGVSVLASTPLLSEGILAKSDQDERSAVERRITQTIEEHGLPTVTGWNRFVDGQMILNNNMPANLRRRFSDKPFTFIGGFKIRFEDSTEKIVGIARNPGEKLLVYFDNRYYPTHITKSDRANLARNARKLESGIDEQIQSSLQERYQSKTYQEMGQ